MIEVLSVHTGHDPDYLLGQVGQGRENYYLGGSTRGEPPGRWWGSGAQRFGLEGEVQAADMKDLYSRYLDPRDPAWDHPSTRGQCDKLGRTPQKFKDADAIFDELYTKERKSMSAERLAQVRADALRQVEDDYAAQVRGGNLAPLDVAAASARVEAIVRERVRIETEPTPERLRELRSIAERQVQQSVSFIDATFSPDKDVTAAHTAFARAEQEAMRRGDDAAAAHWGRKRQAVEHAIWQGNNAMMAELNKRAGYSRIGRHTKGQPGRWIDAPDWTVAQFFQHDSREHDPQLHIHNAILNRVICADDVVRTLDSRAIHRHKQGAGTIGERVMMAHLARDLGFQFVKRRDGIGWRIRGVDERALSLFSKRSNRLSAPMRAWSRDFVAQVGRPPTALELDRARREISMRTRKAKSKAPELRGEQLDRWEEELRAEVAGGLHRIAETLDAYDPARVGPGDPAARGSDPATRGVSRRVDPTTRGVGDPTRSAGSGSGSGTRATGSPVSFSPSAVIATAVAACQESQSSWGHSELVRQILLALPLGIPADQVGRVATTLAEAAVRDVGVAVPVTGRQPTRSVPDAFRVRSGETAYMPPAGPRYATRGHLRAEAALRRAATVQSGRVVDDAAVARWMATDPVARRLSPDQAAAVRGLLTTGSLISILVGPAGTGKSFTMGVAAKAWRDLTGGRLIGLAVSQKATDVLSDDMAAALTADAEDRLADEGIMAMNVTRWVATQDRLHSGKPVHHTDAQWSLTEHDLVVIDEASMVATNDLAEIRRRVQDAGARAVLTGDPRQLGAVGPGGVMAMLADGVAPTFTLTEVRRFDREWERRASLRLRDGDPEAAYEYYRRGQLNDCGTTEQAAQDAAMSYVADTLQGLASIIITASNEAAATTATMVRDQLVELGRVEAGGVTLERDGTVAGVGDVVQARRNRWDLPGVINRQRFTVVARHEDGSLTVRPLSGDDSDLVVSADEFAALDLTRYTVVNRNPDGSGTVRPAASRRDVVLPPEYVRDHVSLGYASTPHAAQGMTTDTCHAVVTPAMSMEALYVAMTRGRHRNMAHVATHPEAPGEWTGETHMRERMPVQQVMATILGREREAADAALVQLRNDIEHAKSMETITNRWEDAIRFLGRTRMDTWLDDLAVMQRITEEQRAQLAADPATEALSRLLRSVEQAGDDPAEVLAEAVGERSLTDARSLAQVLHHRITERYGGAPTPPQAQTLGDRMPRDLSPQWQSYLADLSAAADRRRRELAEAAVNDPPQWAVDAFGPVPADPIARLDWEHRAGTVAAYRETVGWTDDTEAIGPSPIRPDEPGLSATERRAAWHAAWNALGRPEATADEEHLTEGQLRIRLDAWRREQQWAPQHVDDQLRAAGRESAKHRTESTILSAKADARAAEAAATADAAEAARLADEVAAMRAEAERTAALADMLEQVERDLTGLDEARAQWYVETAQTREAAQRAEAELERRGIDLDHEPDRVTADEWLRIQEEGMRAEDAHRPIMEGDIADPVVDELPVDDDAPTVADDAAPAVDAVPTVADDGVEMPAGLPTPAATAAALLAAARVAAQVYANRRSEEAHAAMREAEERAAEAAADEARWTQAREEAAMRDAARLHDQRAQETATAADAAGAAQ